MAGSAGFGSGGGGFSQDVDRSSLDVALGIIPSGSASSNNSLSSNSLWGKIENLFRSQAAQNDKNMQFNAEQAELNRQWQEYMSNTSYQRAMKDMAAAGLNPILAYQQGGATVPTGSSASSNGSTSFSGSDILKLFTSLISLVPSLASLLG